ncbi:hypothetical protein ACIQ2D_09055 [Lysinibacillus sp. NPDC097287]|uniref:hypothetical protein n=1 Tax=Lysinibacillus sp. NPDC097287 TaxID=3364144 RepID=UPI003801FF60
MSKYEVDVLKDLKDSKKRVMTNVVEQIAQREVKKKYLRWQYSLLTVILTVCIGLFIYTQFNEERPLSASDVKILDEKTIEMFLGMANQEFMNETFQTLLEMDAFYAYALDKGIVFNEDTIVEQDNRTQDIYNLIKNDPEKIEEFTKSNITLDEFFEEFLEPNTIKMIAQSELMKIYYKKYEDAFPLHAYLAVKNESMQYFLAKYGEEIKHLEEKYQLSAKTSYTSNQLKTGYIAAIEGDRFLVDPANNGRISNEENNEKPLHGMWFPIHDVIDKVNVGDYVHVKYSLTSTEGADTAANLLELEIIE